MSSVGAVNNVVVKVHADVGNTVLFRTTPTGGALQISLDNAQWYTVGGDPTESGFFISFIAPIQQDASGNVFLNCAKSNNIASGEALRAVVVGADTEVIGYNLLPEIVYNLRDILDDQLIIKDSKLPNTLIYSVNGLLPDSFLSDSVARLDKGVVAPSNLPANISYLDDSGLVPIEALPEEALDNWTDLTVEV